MRAVFYMMAGAIIAFVGTKQDSNQIVLIGVAFMGLSELVLIGYKLDKKK